MAGEDELNKGNMATAKKRKRTQQDSVERVLHVAGYKSIGDEVSIPLRRLTLIAGVNSSGKSSFMQPFLLLKQTLEAEYNAGPMLVHGPNVQLTDWSQTLNRKKSASSVSSRLSIGMVLGDSGLTNVYSWSQDSGLSIESSVYMRGGQDFVLHLNSDHAMIEEALRAINPQFFRLSSPKLAPRSGRSRSSTSAEVDIVYSFGVSQGKCFLEPYIGLQTPAGEDVGRIGGTNLSAPFERFLRSIIHVPGLRGNPERTYNSSSVTDNFPGTMELYVASVISGWQAGSDDEKAKLKALSEDLERLGLTWKVSARKINDASVELRVGRMPHAQQGGAQDLVNIVDVGFGVSQTLPVLLALRAAAPGQTVYIEQPEIHLHPRAQVILGSLLVEAANRGVYVIVETHSSLVLRAVQTAVVKGKINETDVSLNWFTRDTVSGRSRVETAALDRLGRFGEWPVDFDEVAEQVEWEYVESVQRAAHD